MANFQAQFLAQMRACVVSAGGVVPDMSNPVSFESEALNLLGSLNAAIAGGIQAQSSQAQSSAVETAIVVDQKSAGSSGGTFSSGAWRTRDINTVQKSQPWLSVLNNQISIDGLNYPGEYLFEWSCPAYAVQQHQSSLLNVDTNARALGMMVYTHVYGTDAPSSGVHAESLTTETTYEIQNYGRVTRSTYGFGNGFPGLIPIFSIVKITRLSSND